MRNEHDFTAAERGRFYIKDAIMAPPPVYLEPDVLTYLTPQAQARGATLSEVTNDMLRDVIARIKAAV